MPSRMRTGLSAAKPACSNVIRSTSELGDYAIKCANPAPKMTPAQRKQERMAMATWRSLTGLEGEGGGMVVGVSAAIRKGSARVL